jgi:hypothetical protein
MSDFQSSGPLDSVKLKNGSEAPKAEVVTTFMAVELLAKSTSMGDVLAFHDLAMSARDSSYVISVTTG